jgi:DNA repair ATPase RecN
MGLFSSKRKSRLYGIEIDDESIDKDISKLILHVEQKINEFKQHIDYSTFVLSDEELSQLRRVMGETKDKINHLQRDLETISSLKLANQEYFIIKDEAYFADKKVQLKNMNDAVYQFIQILEQHPSTNELREDLLSTLITDLQQIHTSLQRLLADDRYLREIYKKIAEM